VTGYTGSMSVPSSGATNQLRPGGKRKRPSAEAVRQAEAQIAQLRSAILQEAELAPKQVAAGQLVSAKLNLKRSDDKLLQLSVTVGPDTHSFSFQAPPEK
jgi:hypothetical protein